MGTRHQSGSRSAPAFVLTGEQVSGRLASGTRIGPARALLASSRDLATPSPVHPPQTLPARAFPNYMCPLSLERGRQNPDSPFLALEEASPAQ